MLQGLLRRMSGNIGCDSPGLRQASESVRLRLQQVADTFLEGYRASLTDSGLDVLGEQLEKTTSEFRGFAYEGAAMGLDLLDQLKPWRSGRIESFLRGQAAPHKYMVHVGVGWSIARLRWRLKTRLARLDPLLRWLAVDGFGFHQGYFHWQRHAQGENAPSFLHGYGLRAFDQGLGRSLWFVEGASPERIGRSIATFPISRQGDLWSGVGLACAYAGGAEAADLAVLRFISNGFRSHLAQGAAFAAAARDHAGNPSPSTELACRCLCGVPARYAIDVCSQELWVAQRAAENPYQVWRQRIQMHFVGQHIGLQTTEATVV